MLVTIDIPAYVIGIEKQLNLIDATFDANFFENDLRDFARSIDIEYLGLQKVFRESFEKSGLFFHWNHLSYEEHITDSKILVRHLGHWNYEGHKVVANALTNKIKSIICSNK